jgi:hypothetical protein
MPLRRRQFGHDGFDTPVGLRRTAHEDIHSRETIFRPGMDADVRLLEQQHARDTEAGPKCWNRASTGVAPDTRAAS